MIRTFMCINYLLLCRCARCSFKKVINFLDKENIIKHIQKKKKRDICSLIKNRITLTQKYYEIKT